MSSQVTQEVIEVIIGNESEGFTKLKMPNGCAFKCGTIKNMQEDIGDDDNTPVPIPNTKQKIIEKVIEFYNINKDVPIKQTDEEQLDLRRRPLEGANLEFVNVPLKMLFDLILTANFLDYKFLLDICCKAIAEMIKEKTPEEIKKIFGVEGNFTEEEKQQVLEENPWLELPEEQTSSSGGGGGSSSNTIAE